jgi:hypothetical protein
MNTKEKMMSEQIEPVVMPVCPYCKTAMRPQYYVGYYESFSEWVCECEEIPGAEEVRGAWGVG